MFGIDFSELVVIMVVALIVIGPEHLPKVARTAGHLWGRLQRYVNGIKSDIAREMEIDELRKIQEQAREQANSIEKILTQDELEVKQKANEAVAQQPTHVIIEEWEREFEDASKPEPEQKNPPDPKNSPDK